MRWRGGGRVLQLPIDRVVKTAAAVAAAVAAASLRRPEIVNKGGRN